MKDLSLEECIKITKKVKNWKSKGAILQGSIDGINIKFDSWEKIGENIYVNLELIYKGSKIAQYHLPNESKNAHRLENIYDKIYDSIANNGNYAKGNNIARKILKSKTPS